MALGADYTATAEQQLYRYRKLKLNWIGSSRNHLVSKVGPQDPNNNIALTNSQDNFDSTSFIPELQFESTLAFVWNEVN